MTKKKYGDEITESIERAELKEKRLRTMRQVAETIRLNKYEAVDWVQPDFLYKDAVKIDYIKIMAKTDKAVLLRLADEGEEWFPISCCHFDLKNKRVAMPKWFIETKGLERFLDADYNPNVAK